VTASRSAANQGHPYRSVSIAVFILGAGVCLGWAQDFRSSLVVGPYSLSFGDVLVGKASDSQTITLIGTATTGVQIDKITITGPFSQANNCPLPPASLAKNDTCGVEVSFRPVAAGPASGAVSVFHDRISDPIKVSLLGNGTLNPSSVTFSPSSLNFGEQEIGTTSPPQTVTLHSAGQRTLLLSSISSAGDFTIMPASSCEKLIGAPAPAANCTVVVTFTPLEPGKREGAVIFMDDANDSPQKVALTGLGREP
jgi:hypothetical protein